MKAVKSKSDIWSKQLMITEKNLMKTKLNKYRIINFEVENPEIRKGEIVFPRLDYSENKDLNLASTTLQAAYSTISNHLGNDYLSDLDWSGRDNPNWHNEVLLRLSTSITNMISIYQSSPSLDLLKRIFVRIHLWGGNAGRSVFIRNGGFEKNFNADIYIRSIIACKSGDYYNALKILNKIKFVSTAFSTKHIHFWSLEKAPIYDSIIAAVVFGESSVKEKDYERYLHVLGLLAEYENSTLSKIERNLFNWASTPEGKYWINLRLQR